MTKTLPSLLISILLFPALLSASQTTPSFQIDGDSSSVLQNNESLYEPLRDSYDYLSHLLQDGTCTLEWEVPTLSLKSIQVIGSDGERELSKKEVLASNVHTMINNQSIISEASTILEYWHFRSKNPLTQSKYRINLLVPKTVALGIRNLKADYVGLVNGITINIDLEETDDSYKPKGFKKRPDGKLDIVDVSEEKPHIQVTRITKKTTPNKEAWLSTLTPADSYLPKSTIPNKPARTQRPSDEL